MSARTPDWKALFETAHGALICIAEAQADSLYARKVADELTAAALENTPSPVEARADGVREAAEQIRYHWEVIQGQCSEGDGFTERAATDLELSIVALEAALESTPARRDEP